MLTPFIVLQNCAMTSFSEEISKLAAANLQECSVLTAVPVTRDVTLIAKVRRIAKGIFCWPGRSHVHE